MTEIQQYQTITGIQPREQPEILTYMHEGALTEIPTRIPISHEPKESELVQVRR